MISLLERLLGFADSAFSCSFSVVGVSPAGLEAVVSLISFFSMVEAFSVAGPSLASTFVSFLMTPWSVSFATELSFPDS